MAIVNRRRIYLVRHGEVDYFSDDSLPEDPILTSLGIEQAIHTGKYLAGNGVTFDRIVTSTYRRASMTAELIAGELGSPVTLTLEPSLKEIKGGDASTLSERQLEEACLVGVAWALPSTRFLNGESVEDFTDRVQSVINALLANADWQNVLIVAHGGVNTAVLSRALTGNPSSYLPAIEQDYACLNLVEVGVRGDWLVRLMNYSPESNIPLQPLPSTMERFLNNYRTNFSKTDD